MLAITDPQWEIFALLFPYNITVEVFIKIHHSKLHTEIILQYDTYIFSDSILNAYDMSISVMIKIYIFHFVFIHSLSSYIFLNFNISTK